MNESLNSAMETAFSALVPSVGKASTKEGEILRAFGRIYYRWNNDGDQYFTGYGCETVGPAATFIIQNVPAVAAALKGFPNQNTTSDADYTALLETVGATILGSIAGSRTPNTADFWNTPSLWEEESDDCDD